MATITVVRSGSVSGVARVAFRTVDGTATAPADYGNRSGVLTFAANATSQTFTVPTVSDDFFEGDQTVTLVLSDPVGAQLGQISTATLVITDDDRPGTIGFASDKFTVLESAKTAKITVTRTGGTARDITVQYLTEDITATGGATAAAPSADYVITSGTLTFGAKEITKTFDVPIVSDDLAEGPETVRLRLLNPTGGATLGLTESILTITDDDKPGVIQFSAAVYNATEAAAGVSSTATIVVTRIGGTARGVTVAYQTNNATATSGVDYGATSGILSFGTGVTSLTFTIPVFGDADQEGDETLTVTLSNPTAGATLGNPSTAVVNIVDDEQVIQFSSTTYSVNEAGPTAEITIIRSGSTAAEATVRLTSDSPGDTATPGPGPGADYTGQNVVVTFPAKSAVQKVRIPIVNDTLVEGNETLTLTLDQPTGGAIVGPRGTATLTIVDNDQPGVIRFEKPVFLANEPATGSSLAAVNIVRTGTNLGSGVTVDFAVMDGTATGGSVDYAYANQSTTLTFLAGEVKKTVNITVFADTLIESNETVILKLSNPTLGAALAPPVGAAPGVTSPDAQLAIVSDDRPGVFQFSAATYTTTEALGVTVNATITVNRIGTAATLGSDVTVDYLITGGTASFGEDYALPNSPAIGGRLRFGAGVTSQTFNVIDPAGHGGRGRGDHRSLALEPERRGDAGDALDDHHQRQRHPDQHHLRRADLRYARDGHGAGPDLPHRAGGRRDLDRGLHGGRRHGHRRPRLHAHAARWSPRDLPAGIDQADAHGADRGRPASGRRRVPRDGVVEPVPRHGARTHRGGLLDHHRRRSRDVPVHQPDCQREGR